jgi:glucose-1-phosphate cytidylyltransferase
VVDLYAGQGFGEFVLCTGYKGELIEDYVRARGWPEGVRVECADTGLDTPTGGRVHRIRDRVGEGTFFVTYGDGLADIDLGELADRHRSSGALATMTVVRPELQFGVAELGEDDRVAAFHEKPPLDHWINGGFFCFEPAVFDFLDEASVLEREPLEALAAAGELSAYRHSGFWECMDTYKDAVTLNDLWAAGAAPWRRLLREPLR